MLASPIPSETEASQHKPTGNHWFHQQVQKKTSAGHGVRAAPKSIPWDRGDSVRRPGGARGRKGHTGSPRTQHPAGAATAVPQEVLRAATPWAQPEGHSGVPGVTSFKRAARTPRATPTPRLSRRRPGLVTSGKGGAHFSKSGAPLPGTADQGRAAPTPGPRRGRTHRAWPLCRPRRAGSPRGRAPPAGRSTPPRHPAARAAAAPCSAPWAPGRVRPEGAQPGSAPRAPASARSFTLGPAAGPAQAPPRPPLPPPPSRAAPGR